MKKNALFIIAIILIFSASHFAQNIEATLGGSSSSDYFDVTDNSGNVLFRIDGTGKTGVGTSTLSSALNVNGDVNLEASNVFKIDNKKVLETFGFNTLVGVRAGNGIGSGDYNTILGYDAGFFLTGGNSNTFVGRSAGYNSANASYNTFIGYLAGYKNDVGERNTFVGNGAGKKNLEGNNNTFFGFDAGFNCEAGHKNVYIGYSSGYSGVNSSNNVYVGNNAGADATGSDNVFIGYAAGSTEIGSNLLYIENSPSSSPLIYGDFSANELTVNGDLTVTGTITELSDRRYKTEIEPVKNALRKIEAINAVYYKWDKEKHPDLVVSDEREIGVIAQDVEKVFPELVKTDKKGFKSVNYAKLSAVLLQAVKEQQERIENLEKKYSEQTNAIYELTKAVYSFKKENEIKMSSNIK
ncbi:MAG: tail fiber domain-containing protein [Chlorobi bacterium]|nr:tail fiber domain-containing protein [Chlorobiota bacterium]